MHVFISVCSLLLSRSVDVDMLCVVADEMLCSRFNVLFMKN